MAEEKLWEQLTEQGEPNDWYARFTSFLHLGPGRSLTEAYRQTGKVKKTTKNIHITPQWSKMAQQWRWIERAQAYDMHLEEQRLKAEEQLIRDQVMTSGYALEHNRVLALEQMVKRLNDAVEEGRLFVKKKVGTTIFEEMDGALLREWRGLLDDISKETGGRVKKTETKVDGSLDITGARETLMNKLGGLREEDEK